MKNKKNRDRIGLGYAVTGVITSLKTEFNMRIHVIIMFVVIFSGFLFRISVFEWLFVILAIGFVLAFELMNTVVEATYRCIDLKKNTNQPKILKI